MLRDKDAAVDPFSPLGRFTFFAVLRRYAATTKIPIGRVWIGFCGISFVT
jgi:hypothetical protein